MGRSKPGPPCGSAAGADDRDPALPGHSSAAETTPYGRMLRYWQARSRAAMRNRGPVCTGLDLDLRGSSPDESVVTASASTHATVGAKASRVVNAFAPKSYECLDRETQDVHGEVARSRVVEPTARTVDLVCGFRSARVLVHEPGFGVVAHDVTPERRGSLASHRRRTTDDSPVKTTCSRPAAAMGRLWFEP